jgi:hypothetical protein
MSKILKYVKAKFSLAMDEGKGKFRVSLADSVKECKKKRQVKRCRKCERYSECLIKKYEMKT